MNSQPIVIYTDGACKGNPGPGGYAALIIRDGRRTELSGGRLRTTNNRMEMLALIEALQTLDGPAALEVFTDSQYLLGGLQKGWVKGWKRKGWLTASGSPVLNKDLWIKLELLLLRHRVVYHWVRGHSSSPENNRCDELAVKASYGKDLPVDEAYETPPPPSPAPQKPPARAPKRPDNWDDDLFSSASGGPVNWDF